MTDTADPPGFRMSVVIPISGPMAIEIDDQKMEYLIGEAVSDWLKYKLTQAIDKVIAENVQIYAEQHRAQIQEALRPELERRFGALSSSISRALKASV